jgi:hypothetical protein
MIVAAPNSSGRVGRLLYRRPLAADELAARVGEARLATAKLGNFYDGLAATLGGMLVSPQFLFVIDGVEPTPNAPGAMRLDAYSKASRLSFFLRVRRPTTSCYAPPNVASCTTVAASSDKWSAYWNRRASKPACACSSTTCSPSKISRESKKTPSSIPHSVLRSLPMRANKRCVPSCVSCCRKRVITATSSRLAKLT